MSQKFIMTRDINGFNGFGLRVCLDIWSVQLSANTEQHFTVPSNHKNWIAIFSYDPGLRVFVAVGQTAAVPGGSIGTGTSALNPTAKQVVLGDVISLITPDTSAFVTVELYAL